MFVPGQEVVCIDASPTNIFGHCELVKGKRYIVEWCGEFSHHDQPPIISVLLVGVRRTDKDVRGLFGDLVPDSAYAMLRNMPFRATRFAPIQKTDISELEALLQPTEQKVLEDA